MKLKKIFICVLAALMFGTNIYAAEAEAVKLPELTIADAVKYTLASDTSYLNLLDTGTLNQQSLVDTVNDYNSGGGATNDGSYMIRQYVTLMQANAKIALQSPNEKQKRLSLQSTLTKYFMDIITAENALALARLSLENREADLNILQTRARLGLASQATYAASQVDFKKAENDLVLEEANLESAYIALNQLMGKELDSRYTLVLDFEYAPLENVNLERVISDAIRNSAAVKQREDEREVAGYRLDRWWVFTSNTNNSRVDVEIAAAQAIRALEDAKDNVRSSVTNAYSNIKNLEVQINSNQLELQNMLTQQTIKEVELHLGKITALDLKKYELQVLQHEEKLRQQIYNHRYQVWQFENPEVLSSGSSGGSGNSSGNSGSSSNGGSGGNSGSSGNGGSGGNSGSNGSGGL